jgi:protoporphyrinogen/coproporphyrinogen III oxidase
MSHDVIVIGAGISGLTTAHNLLSRGYNVQVLERQVNIGGNATSERFDGFLMEHGPTTMNAAMPGAMSFVHSLQLDQSRVDLGPNVIKRYLRDEHGLHGISTHPLGFFLSGYLSPAGRLSMLAEILRPRKKDGNEESIYDFATRRFGRQFADKVIDPMVAGIFMGDAKALSINSAFPRLLNLEQKFGSITRGVIAARRGSEPGRQLFSWPQGIGTLPKSIAGALKQSIRTNTAVTKISRTPSGYDVHTARSGTLRAPVIVLAVQPHVSASLLEALEPTTATALNDIQAPPIGVVFAGYHKSQVSHSLDGLGFLSTSLENKIISGAQFSSTMFTGRAPEAHVAISCYVGGARNPKAAVLPEQELSNAVHKELSELLGIKGDPVVSRTKYWPRGLPHYTLGHDTRKQTIESANQRLPGLYLTGNYLRGVSVTNCIESANITAENVNTELRGTDNHLNRKIMIAKRSIR